MADLQAFAVAAINNARVSALDLMHEPEIYKMLEIGRAHV